MNKGVDIFAMLRNEYLSYFSSSFFIQLLTQTNNRDATNDEGMFTPSNKMAKSANVPQTLMSEQLISSKSAINQSPDSNFMKELLIQMESNGSEMMMMDDNHIENSLNKMETPKGSSSNEEQTFQNYNQQSTNPQTPLQKRSNYQGHSRSKSLFFVQSSKKQSKFQKMKSNQTQSDKSSEKDDEGISQNIHHAVHDQLIENNDDDSEQEKKMEYRRDTIADSFNQLKPSESAFSTQRSQKNESNSRIPFGKDNKMNSLTSTTSIMQGFGDTMSLQRKTQFSFGKSDKQMQDTPKRYDHRKKSFQFTNFFKPDDTDSEEINQSQVTSNKATAKVTPIKINHSISNIYSGAPLNMGDTSTTNGGAMLNQTKIKKSQGWNLAVQLSIINRFISKMRDQSSELNYSKLQPHHLSLINDISYQNDGGSDQFFSSYVKERSSRLLSFIPIFEPDNTLLIIFKVFVIFALVIEIFIVPIEIGFQIYIYEENSDVNTLLRVIPLLFFIFDFIFRMNTGYYQNGNFIQKRRNVILYFKVMLVLDIINIISLIFKISISAPFLFLLFVARLVLVNLKCSDVSDHFSFIERYPASYNITKLAFILLLVGHVCGCGFHFVTTIDAGTNSEPTWIEFYKFQHYDTKNRYLLSIYYSTITMITVGYGDITPQTQIERIYVICIVIISGTVFAYAVNMIGAIFQEKEKKIADYKQMKFDISNYLINRSINKRTQLKVYNYLDYVYKKESEAPEKGQKILNIISEDLKNEVYKEFYGTILTNSRLFSNKFSQQFIQKVSLKMEEKMYAPGEIIYDEKKQEYPQMYYILKGKVEMFTHNGDQKHFLGYLNSGDSMCHRNFYASLPYDWSCASVEVTHLVFISQQNFLDCLKEFPLDKEVFQMNKDDILFGQNRYMNPCFSCGKQTHMVVDCPLIHYQKNKQVIINRHLYSVPEKDRRPHQRSVRQKLHTVQQIKKIRNALKVTRTALQQSFFQNTSVRGSSIVINEQETDKDFYFKMTKFRFDEDNHLVLDSQASQESHEEEEEDDEEYSQEQSEGSEMESSSSSTSQSPNGQRNEIIELQEEDEQTEQSPFPLSSQKPPKEKSMQRQSSSSSIKSLKLTEVDENQSHQSNALYKRTLTNQIKLKQLQKQLENLSLNNSIDIEKNEKMDEFNSSFFQKSHSSSNRKSTAKLDSLPVLTAQRSDSSKSQREIPAAIIPQIVNIVDNQIKKSDTFKLNLQPILLHNKNLNELINKQPLDDSFSILHIAQDDKSSQKSIQETSNIVTDNLNNSTLKTTRQSNKRKSGFAPEQNKPSSFKNYQQTQVSVIASQNIGGQTVLHVNTPLFRPSGNQIQLGQVNLPILSNQSSANSKQTKVLSINSPMINNIKRDPITATNAILQQYVISQGNQKASGEQSNGRTSLANEQNIVNLQDKMNRVGVGVGNQNNILIPYYDQAGILQQLALMNNDNHSPTQIQQINQQNLLNNLQLNIQNPQQFQLIQQMQKKRGDIFSYPDFEQMKDFTIYYPQYNCSNVLKKIVRKAIPIRKKKITLQNFSKVKGQRRNSSFKHLPLPASFQSQQTQK